MESSRRPRLTPAIADIRRAVRALLPAQGLVLVGLSGGADSLALAAATAFEAGRAGIRAGAVIVDHNLQPGSADVAARAAHTARQLGLDPVLVLGVSVVDDGTGPEAAARTSRYAAFDVALTQTGASGVLLGHTLDDQAETVLLGLARGSGPTSLRGMAARTGLILRPLLGIRRAATRQFCADAGLEPWSDPQNFDPRYSRVRVRQTVLPMLESELGPGVGLALARTSEALREDSDALDELARTVLRAHWADRRIAAAVLAAHPAAIRQRVIRFAVEEVCGVWLDRGQALAVAALVTNWHGQGALSLPGIRVIRQGGSLIFSVPGPT
ncbi:tRNA lysidine(34) synthetase TilS [Cryobacterium sp. TMT1-3]|uniref:tRNA(Ile)-lysidine synthase n=1 Tax=Cryobacterium luteum TaxID=1424661 RepID=A0A1H8BRI8_9MICO|nr:MULTISPECIES: tRNA lysidine(34) synthetase TilS [Cryobacterium]TFB89086.1 tRNA lysidine(34) synthetase TilS [Cryobacterium luteum]TFC29577.1 tRNA lysidine(34) synthetase TilS [Cryobacterium sp. TMT1-3]SEM84628.1 tRNA(Ile)-lysidine synthase [Cryobacterium luteum]